MQRAFVGTLLLGSLLVGVLSEVFVARMVHPPDEAAAFLGGLWIAMPFLATALLTLLIRRHSGALTVLLIVFLIAGGIGLEMYFNAASIHSQAREEVRTAVLPGEDPSHGPAAMRKTGADVGAFVTDVFSILLCVIVPPVQLGFVLFPSLIAYAVSRRRRGKEEVPAQRPGRGEAAVRDV